MIEHKSNNKRIAKNTLLLYFRMILMMLIGLYTSRVILHALGASDLGIYNVVGGVVATFGVINNTMATGSMRFIATAIGKGENVQETFSAVFLIHCAIAVLTFILLESVGLWFLWNKLNIPADRMNAAFWVLQFSTISSMVLITQVPYNSCIIAHEKMGAFAYLSILDVIFKLGIAFSIRFFDGDKLILYGLLLLLQSLVMLLIYRIYSQKKFDECHYKKVKDRQLVRNILTFSGWNTVGSVAWILNTQGVGILFNMFYGTVINAAINISNQINDKVGSFVNNFQTASNPQIVKLYASGDIKEMFSLVVNTSRFSAYVYMALMIPLFVEMDVILKIWLSYGIPQYTLEFARIVLIQSLIIDMDRPFMKVLHATGKLKLYSITAGLCLLLPLPTDYLLLRYGIAPNIVYMVNIIPWVIEFIIIISLVKKYTSMGGAAFYLKFISIILLIFSISIVPSLILKQYIINEWIQIICVSALSWILLFSAVYRLGLNNHLRQVLKQKVAMYVKKI